MYFAPGINVLLSYSMDDAPSLDWAVSINADALTEAYSDQLFIQTPSLPLGIHTLKLTISHPNDSWIEPTMFIVQNKTQDRNLDPIPQISTSAALGTSTISAKGSPTSIHRTNHRISGGSVAAITVGIVVGITIASMFAIWIGRRHLRKKSSQTMIPGSNVIPFDNTQSTEPRRFRIAEHETREKTNKYRDALGISSLGAPNQPDMEVTGSSSVDTGEQVRRSGRVRYRIHEDGGELVAEADEEEQIVDLPPVYSTVRTAVLSAS